MTDPGSAHSTDSPRGPGDRLSPEEAALAHRPFAELTDVELRRWCSACGRLSRLDPSRLARWRWRRRWRRALRAWARRIAGQVGSGPPLCERCGTQRPTVHVVYGHGAEQRTRHFCAGCSELEPPGWFVRAEAGS